MSRFWIRNRGRIDGPYTLDRLNSLLSRRRIGRHCHISLDKTDWYSADEFLRRQRRVDRRTDEGEFTTTDADEYAPTLVVSRSDHQSAFDDDESSAVSVEYDDDGEEEDSSRNWHVPQGVLVRPARWLRKNAAGLCALILVGVMAVTVWLYFQETWGQDAADLALLTKVAQKITLSHSAGATGDAWMKLQAEVEPELVSIVDRLSKRASAQDHVKQELLFAARDDIPLMLKQLVNDDHEASQRVLLRFERVEEMIGSKKRQHLATILSAVPELPRPHAVANSTDSPQATGELGKKSEIAELRSQVGSQREQVKKLLSEDQRSAASSKPSSIPGRPVSAKPISPGR